MGCDGAKSICAMRVGSSSQAAMKVMFLALNNCSTSDQGVIADDVDKTIRNIGRMVSTGMAITDKEIIDDHGFLSL